MCIGRSDPIQVGVKLIQLLGTILVDVYSLQLVAGGSALAYRPPVQVSRVSVVLAGRC